MPGCPSLLWWPNLNHMLLFTVYLFRFTLSHPRCWCRMNDLVTRCCPGPPGDYLKHGVCIMHLSKSSMLWILELSQVPELWSRSVDLYSTLNLSSLGGLHAQTHREMHNVKRRCWGHSCSVISQHKKFLNSTRWYGLESRPNSWYPSIHQICYQCQYMFIKCLGVDRSIHKSQNGNNPDAHQ